MPESPASLDDLHRENERLRQEIAALSRRANECFSSEAALRKSEERYRLLAENARDVIYRISYIPTRHFEYISPSVTAISGYTPEEHYANPDIGFSIIHPDDLPLFMKLTETPDGFSSPVEVRRIRKDGTVIWTEQQNTAILDENGVLVAIEGVARDITERKLSEMNRFDRERQYRILFEKAGEGIFILDPANPKPGYIVTANQAAADMHGYTVKELRDLTFADLDISNSPTETLGWLDQASRGEWSTGAANHRRKDGSVIHIEYTVGPIEFHRKPRVLAFVRDITERTHTEERYQLLAEHSLDMISRHSLDGVYQYVSPACRNLLGYEPEELIGRSSYEFYHPDDLAAIRASHRAMITHPTEYVMTYRIRRKNGTYIWFETRSNMMTTEDDEPGIIAVSRDITTRKRLELEKDLLFNYSIDMLCIAGFDGRFKQINPAWSKALGWSDEELMGSPYLEFVLPEDRDATIAIGNRLAGGRAVLAFENRYRHKNGGVRWLSWNAVPLTEEKLVFAVVRDVTHQKQLENELQRLATTDSLSGCNNRRHYLALTEQELARVKRYRDTLSLVFIDIDLFKVFNDTYGHLAGDEAIRLFPRICSRILRTTDILGRYGGEEFAITLVSCDLEHAYAIADRLRSTIEQAIVAYEGQELKFTISCGVTQFDPERDTTESLLSRADQALYIAKRTGRNRVVTIPPRDGE